MRWIAVVASIALGGCFESRLNYCDNGAVCPASLACTERSETACGEAVDVAPCKTMPDRASCSSAQTPVGTCASGVCTVCDPNIEECRWPAWKPMTSTTQQRLNALWVAADNDVYVVGDGSTVLHYDGTAWSSFSAPSADRLVGIWGSGAELFVVAQSGEAFHYAGGSWQAIPPVINQVTSMAYSLFGIWGADVDHVFAVGELGLIARLQGNAWQTMAANNMSYGLRAISGTSPTNAYAVGNGGYIQHYSGSNWQIATSTIPIAGVTFNGLWTSDAGDVVAVGFDTRNGLVETKQANAWNSFPVLTPQLQAVWGTSSDDVFAVGTAGTIMHFANAQWTSMTSGSAEELLAVAGTASNVYAVGTNGTILRLAK